MDIGIKYWEIGTGTKHWEMDLGTKYFERTYLLNIEKWTKNVIKVEKCT